MGSSPEPAGNFSLITSILLSITEGWASQPKRSLAGLVMNAPEDKAMWKIRFAQLLAELEGASDEVVDRRFEAFSEDIGGGHCPNPRHVQLAPPVQRDGPFA